MSDKVKIRDSVDGNDEYIRGTLALAMYSENGKMQ